MADMAASVLARLKNKAVESGRSYQICLQLFCQEEFLRRLEKSKYADNLVLKGGLFIYFVTDFDSRVTVDVDFLLQKVPNTLEQFEQVMGFANDEAMQKKWKAFCSKIDIKTDDFSTVLLTIRRFLARPFTTAVDESEFTMKWSAMTNKWN